MARSGKQRGRSPDSIERLYVLWLGSVVLLILGIAFVGFVMRGNFLQQNATLAELRDRLLALEEAEARRQAGSPTPRVSPETPESADARDARLPRGERGGTTITEPVVEARPDTTQIRSLLTAALRTGDPMSYALADADAARRAIQLASDQDERIAWPGEIWADLAVASRLLGDDAAAETYARRASAAGDAALPFCAVSARLLLDGGRALEALAYAQWFVDRSGGVPESGLLLAETYLTLDRRPGAAEAIATLDVAEVAGGLNKLWLGRIYIALERWEGLSEVLASLNEVPDELAAERDFQRAVLLIREARDAESPRATLVEALAVLDYLLGDSPDDYDVQVWRGVALLEARQYEASRQAFDQSAALNAGRPDAWYWRGTVEIRAGKPDEAVAFLEKALAASARYAPAWEALGTIALNRGDLTSALQNLSQATLGDPQRPSAHFLTALAHAKASRREDTAVALRRALRLDESYAAKALQAEVIARLFEPGEIENMLEPNGVLPDTADGRGGRTAAGGGDQR